MKAEKIKITVFVEKEVWETEIQPLNQQYGIRRDELLNQWLDNIIEKIEKQPTNSLPKDIYRLFYNQYMPIDKKKVNLTLRKETLSKLDNVLSRKNVSRGLFLSVFLNSLDKAISDLKFCLDDPFFQYKNDDFRCLELFPTQKQAEIVKEKHEELLALLREVDDEF